MPYFVRMISKAKWYVGDLLPDDSPADAITICSRTSSNTLSLWKIDSVERYEDVLVALVSKQERIDAIDLVFINEQDLNDSGLEVANSFAQNPFTRFQNNHFDIINLSYSKLGIFKDIILKTLRYGNKHQRYTKRGIIECIRKYIDEGSLDTNQMNQKLLIEIDKYGR